MRSPTRRIAYFLLLCLGLVAGGLLAQRFFQAEEEQPTPALTAIELGDTKPLHQFGDIYLGGQPPQTAFELLKKQGVTTIINLRHPSETDWDESALAEEMDLQYVNLPIQGEEDLTDELFDRALATLRGNNRGKTLVHCASCNRVGAIWYAYRLLEQNANPDEAEQEARTAGMRSDWILEAAQSYVNERNVLDR